MRKKNVVMDRSESIVRVKRRTKRRTGRKVTFQCQEEVKWKMSLRRKKEVRNLGNQIKRRKQRRRE